jgi:TonB family protein
MGRPARVQPAITEARPSDTAAPLSSGGVVRRARATADDRARPEVFREVDAEYPSLARRRGIEANVVASVRVNADGTVQSVTIISCSVEGFGFEEATERALLDFDFRPATRGGEAISMRIRYTYRFRLD